MRVTKIFSETINISDPINFSANVERQLTPHLKELFAGRCRHGVFIIDVTRVVENSGVKIKDTDLSAKGYLYVKFEALVEVIARWDILTDIEVVKVSPLIIGKNDERNVVVSVQSTPEAGAIQEGHKIPVRVVHTYYKPEQTNITVLAILLTCDKTAPVYSLQSSLTPGDAKELAPLAAEAHRLLGERARLIETRSSDFQFFGGLLYSYDPDKVDSDPDKVDSDPDKVDSADRGPSAWTGGPSAWTGLPSAPLPPNCAAENVLEIIENAKKSPQDVSGVWCRDLSLHRSSPLIAKASREKPAPAEWADYTRIESSPLELFSAVVHNVCEFLRAENSLVVSYESVEELRRHMTIWQAMKQARPLI